jgi:hypothetical protein
MRNKAERRYDRYGEFRLMAEADGYVMARRQGRMPFIVKRKEWDAWARKPELVGAKLKLVKP